jgi:hypothetical protein
VPQILSWLNSFEEWVANENLYEIRGASLLVVMDDKNKIYRIRLIDLGSLELMVTRDEGLLFGVRNLIKMIG